MIKVTFDEDKQTKTISMKVRGHAGQDVKGHDIVCAAASILMYTLAQTVRYIEHRGGFVKKPYVRLGSGSADIVCQPNDEYYALTLHTFFVIEVGYSLLANDDEYKKYVKLIMFGQAEKP